MNNNLLLCEISWEVSNLVGGIHTVLGSKINYAKEYADTYITIGPYKNLSEFEQQDLPGELIPVYEELKQLGLTIHYGLWKTHETSCTCILVEMTGFEKHANEIKGKLWENNQIDSLNSDWFDFDEVMTWSWGCGIVCEHLARQLKHNNTIVHSHEWMCSGATFYFDSNKHLKDELNLRTVFTTHATMLGRAYYGTYGKLLMNEELHNTSAYDIAKSMNVHTKYKTEEQALLKADASTCVSQITKDEIEKLYGVSRVQVTENGFSKDLSFDDCVGEFISTHTELTNQIQNYFKPYYHVGKQMRIGIISGRYEVKSKGYDVTFKALGELNEKLKQTEISKDIVILAPIIAGDFKEMKQEELEFNPNFAPLSTHNIHIDHEIMQLSTHNGLLNRKEDKVKIIFIPRIIDEEHKAFYLTYYQMLQACDFSLFASGYEPWGYTPHESIAYGVVTLTSENAGFGRYWLKHKINNSVVKVVLGQEFDSKVGQIKEFIDEQLHKSSQVQYREKKYALEYSKEISWKVLYENYKKIYESLLS